MSNALIHVHNIKFLKKKTTLKSPSTRGHQHIFEGYFLLKMIVWTNLVIISWLILPPVWIDACPGGSGPPPPAPPPPCISEYRN